jgi:hypothetical protein
MTPTSPLSGVLISFLKIHKSRRSKSLKQISRSEIFCSPSKGVITTISSLSEEVVASTKRFSLTIPLKIAKKKKYRKGNPTN